MGGYFGSAALGGIAGTGEGMAEAAKLNWQQDFEAFKEHHRSIREERNIQLQSQAAQDLERQKGTVVAPGSTLRREGQPDFTAPDTRHPPELLDKLKAETNRLNAEADAIRNGEKYRNKEQKPTLPKVIVKTDEAGNTFLFDENSGSIGTLVPGAPAQEGKSHWFSPDEAARPAEAHKTLWRLPNGTVSPDLSPVYPDIAKRSASTNAGGAPDPLGLRASLPNGGRPPLSNFLGGQKPISAQPAAPAGMPQRATAPEENSSAGFDLDNARARHRDALAKFQSYGSLQRKRDPEGFQAAKEELDLAKNAEAEALDTWGMQQGFQRAAPLLRSK